MTRSARPLEREVLSSIRLALGLEPDLVLWRNAVGQADVADRAGARRLVYGLAVGSADLVGILAVRDGATGAAVGRFVAIEVKRPGEKARPEQAQWLALVRRMGGFACVVVSVEEARAAIDRARGGAYQ